VEKQKTDTISYQPNPKAKTFNSERKRKKNSRERKPEHKPAQGGDPQRLVEGVLQRNRANPVLSLGKRTGRPKNTKREENLILTGGHQIKTKTDGKK